MERSEILVEVVHPPTVGLRTPYSPEAKVERDTELAGTGQECLPGISYLHPLTGVYMCYLEKNSNLYNHTLCHVSLNTGNQ